MAWDKMKVRNPFLRSVLDDIFTGVTRLTGIDVTTLKVDGTLEIATGGAVTGLIIDNLTSTDTAKALSAAQGKVLKDAFDAKTANFLPQSEATTVAGLLADFNSLLIQLKGVGLMAGGEEPG